MAEQIKEIWKNIPGFSGYMASNLGRIKAKRKMVISENFIRHWRKERILVANVNNKHGYLIHTLKADESTKTTWLAHRIIAFAFHKNPENKRFINHKNAVKHDNRIENLEWCTKSENAVHAVLNGLHTPLRGEINGNSRLKPEQVLEIRSLAGKHTQWELARMFKIGRTTVQYIIKRKLWGHLC